MTRATATADEHPKPSLVVILRPELPRHDELVVGRSRSCDLMVEDITVSRRHCRISLQGTPRVEDLGSQRGTWVRGQRLTPGEPREVEPGEPIRLGDAIVVVHPGGPTVVPHRLTVGPGGAWFSVDDAEPVQFGRRRLLSRILQALVDAQVDTPGVPVTMEQLQRLCWPDEVVAPAPAANRIYVAIARLRGMGLASLIQHLDQGYLLPPSVVVQHAAAPPRT